MVSRLERRKDALQQGFESAAIHSGRIMGILATTVRDVTRELGDFATELFELREASRRAADDEHRRQRTLAPADPADPPIGGRPG